MTATNIYPQKIFWKIFELTSGGDVIDCRPWFANRSWTMFTLKKFQLNLNFLFQQNKSFIKIKTKLKIMLVKLKIFSFLKKKTDKKKLKFT